MSELQPEYAQQNVSSPEPASISELVTQYNTLRERRLDLERLAGRLKKEEVAAERAVLAHLESTGHDGIVIDGYQYSEEEKEVYSIKDWLELKQYIVENDAFDLLNKALNHQAVRLRLETTDELPGVGALTIPKLAKRKAK